MEKKQIIYLYSFYRESDKDGDRMISYEEFLAETEREEFEKVSCHQQSQN